MYSPYKLRYHRLFSLGNFENESIDLEREFPADVSPVLALQQLKVEVVTIQEMLVCMKKNNLSPESGNPDLDNIAVLQQMVVDAQQHLMGLQKQLMEKTKNL